MKKELWFILYILSCIFVGFIDFFFETRGIFTLSYDIILAFILIVKKKNVFKFNYVPNNKNIYALLLLLLFPIILNLIVSFYSPRTTKHFDSFFIISIFFKSFTEELIFRGFWLSKFVKERSKAYSIILISLGFTLLHYFPGKNIIFAFLGSVVLSFLYLKIKSILNVFIIHLLSNLSIMYLIPLIISITARYEVKYILQIAIIIVLLFIYLLKLFFKDKSK